MNNKKVIWCISKYASPPRYGVGARLYYIAREFVKLGAEVVIISSDSNHLAKYPESKKTINIEEYDGLTHAWIKTLKYKKNASIKRFLSWFDFEFKLNRIHKQNFSKPDVVIVSSLSLFSIIYGIFLKRKYSCKLVFEVRDIYPLTLTEEFGVSKFNPMVLLLAVIEKIGYKSSDLIVGTMPNLKQHVKEIIGKEKDVFHSPLGVHEIWSKEVSSSNEVDSIFDNSKRFVVGYAGSMGTSNALIPFVKAIKQMKDEKGIHFVLVGDGDLKKDFIIELKGLDNVTMGPKIKQNEIPYFLSKCDILYLSAHDSKIWEYGQSLNKMIDYMMSGKPVIASYSGYQSMLNEADSGIFIPTGDKDGIIEAIKKYKAMDTFEREQMGLRGKKWVEENHKYENIAKNYYEKILSL